MADLYGSAPDSEEISNIISELLHGHGSSASSASSSMPFKPTYMHLLHSSVPLPLQAATQSEFLIPEARHEDHGRFAQLVDRSGTDQRVVGGNSNSAGVLESSSGFYFSDSDGCFTAKVKEGMGPDGRRISSENDLGDFSCDSEKGLEEAPDVQLNSAPPRSSSKRSRAADVHNMSEKRRRSRINEKMKALQNLIPNSNKTDKASMLDEAIEYLKQLQLQVQMLSMRNGMSLHPLYLPGTLQPVQLSQMRMELGEENRPLHLDMTGTLHMNLESSTQNLFNLSNQCTAANESYVPDMSNVVNSETSFVLEPSIQSHLGPFQLPASSQEICRDDLLQHQKIDVNHSEMNLSATVSLPFAQVSDPKSTFDTCIIGRDRQEVGLLRSIEQNFHIDRKKGLERYHQD